MKPLYLMACLLVTVLFSAHAQNNYAFTYDSSGNRLTRAVILLKSATTPDSLFAQKNEEIQEDLIGLQKIRIYPNPTKGLIRIDLPTLIEQENLLTVYDQNGRLILNKPVVSTGNEVDLTSFSSGFYILVIRIGTEKKEWKIIKQ